MSKKEGKVFVGVSGGVDSSVAAALLKQEGYEVTGVFIKVWQPDFLPCNWEEERLSAMRVCATLEIPFLTFDFEDVYKKEVVDYMVAEYQRGRTPNPDVMCNKYVKFGAFFDEAMERGADYIATGHYARLCRETRNPKLEILNKSQNQISKNQTVQLLAGRDKEKDQSYFLWTLTQKQLKSTLFPIGDYKKPQVREMAREFGLPTAEKKDSQGLCFIGKLDMKEFLKHYIKEKTGPVLNQKGEQVGKHDGITFYTLGQRHGFTITEKGDRKPYYVVGKDRENNTLFVAHNGEPALQNASEKEVTIRNTNWISETIPKEGKIYQARTRYRAELSECEVEKGEKGEEEQFRIMFKDTAPLAPPGQSLVLYDHETCLGGGIIC